MKTHNLHHTNVYIAAWSAHAVTTASMWHKVVQTIVHILSRKCHSGAKRRTLPQLNGWGCEAVLVYAAVASDWQTQKVWLLFPSSAVRHHSLASLSSLLLDLAAKRKQSNKERILFRFCNFFYKVWSPAVKKQQRYTGFFLLHYEI